MKRPVIFLSAVLFMLAGGIFAQNIVSLDEAVHNAVLEIEARLVQGSKVVVLNFRSSSQRFSDYVLDEMMTELVRSEKITVVDRTHLELIQQEMQFQMSGDVSDSSAQAIGQILGAQSIVSGSIEEMGGYYRMRFRTIAVETAAMQAFSSINIKHDSQVAALLAPATISSEQQQASAMLQPNGLHFSTKRKTGAGFANWVFGIGSFTLKDKTGGFIVGGLEVTGVAVSLIGVVKRVKGKLPDENAYFGGTDNPAYKRDYDNAELDRTNGMIMLISGGGVYLAGVIIGHILPFTYDISISRKRGTYLGFDSNPMQNISIIPVSTSKGMEWGLMYNISY